MAVREHKAMSAEAFDRPHLAVGVVAWVVNAEERIVEVHQPGRAPRLLTAADTLEGGDILPGFSLAVKEIFPAQA